MGVQTLWQGLLNEIPIYFTCYCKISKPYDFLKSKIGSILEVRTLLTVQDFLESWVFQNHWVAIFLIVFIVVTLELILIKIWTYLWKKTVHPNKECSCSSFQKKEDSHQKKIKLGVSNWRDTVHAGHRINTFPGRITSTLTSEQNEGNSEDSSLSLSEIIQAGTSEHQAGYRSNSSSDRTSSSLLLLHSKSRKCFLSHGLHPENEYETILSSKELFSLMKTNKKKNSKSSCDFSFLKISEFTVTNEELDVTSCPPAHLFLTKDQVRLLEANMSNKITSKLKATLINEAINLYSGSQKPLVQNQHSVDMVISAQAQDSFPGQNIIQNDEFYEAQATSQAQQFIQNRNPVNMQPGTKVSCFAQPQELTSKPHSTNTEDSVQTQDTDVSQQFITAPDTVETKNVIKSLESGENLHGAKYAAQFEDSDKIQNSPEGKNSVYKNTELVLLVLSPNLVAEDVSKLITPSNLNRHSVCILMPLLPTIKGLKNKRKLPNGERKLKLKVPPTKAKKTPCCQVFQVKAHHSSKNRNESECKNNTEKQEYQQRKEKADAPLHLISVSKLMTPSMKKHFRKKLLKIMPTLIKCGFFLQKQNRSKDTEEINFSGSTQQEISGIIKNIKVYDKKSKELNSISPSMLHQLEPAFTTNANELKALSSSFLETNCGRTETPKDPNKLAFDPRVPQHEMPSEVMSEPSQKLVSPPQMNPNRRMEVQKDLPSVEDPYPQFLDKEELPLSALHRQRCFPIAKARKAPISKIFNIPRHGHPKYLPPKTLKSQTTNFLVCSRVLSDRFHNTVLHDSVTEKRKGLALKSPTTALESFIFSKLASPVPEIETGMLECMDKTHKMSPKRVILKAKKAKTFNIAGCDITSHQRQLGCYSKPKTKQGAPIFLSTILSPLMVSLNLNECNRVTVTDRLQRIQSQEGLSLHFNVKPWGLRQSNLTNTPLQSNIQKLDFSKTLRVNKLNIYEENEEILLKSIFSCIMHQLNAEVPKTQVPSKATLKSKLSSTTVEKASNKVSSPEGQPPKAKGLNVQIGGRKEYQPKSRGKTLPASASNLPIDIHQIVSSLVKKVVTSVDSLGYHTSTTEKGEQQEINLHKALPKLTSHSKADLLQINMPVQQGKGGAVNTTYWDYSTSQNTAALQQVYVTDGNARIKKGTEPQRLAVSAENVEEHLSYTPLCLQLQPCLMHEKEQALSAVGNMSSKTKAAYLSPKDRLSAICQYGQESTAPPVTPRQLRKQTTMLLLESSGKTTKYESHLLLKGKRSSDGAQVIKPNGSSPKLGVRKHMETHNEHKEAYLPRIILRSFSGIISLLYESQRQEDSMKRRAMKDKIRPPRSALTLKNIVNDPAYDNSVNRLKLQCNIKEKMVNVKQSKNETGLVMTKVYDPIPSLPHVRMSFSNNVKRTEQHTSHKEKDRAKPLEMKGTMGRKITLKLEKDVLPYVLGGKEFPLLLHRIKQDSKVQEDKLEQKLMSSCVFSPSVSQLNLYSRTEVGEDKPRILKSCPMPPKSQAPSNVKRISLADSAICESLHTALESKCLLQKEEETGKNIVDIKVILDLICTALRRKNSPFRQILHGKKAGCDSKKQELEIMQKKGKHNLDVVQNKSWDSIFLSTHVEWDSRTKEIFVEGLNQFCLPSLTLQELKEATCKEPEKLDRTGDKQRRVDREVKEQGEMDEKGKEQERVDGERKEQEKVEGEDEEQRREDGERKEESKVESERQGQEKMHEKREEQGRVGGEMKEQGRVDTEKKDLQKVDRRVEEHRRLDGEKSEQRTMDRNDKEKGKVDLEREKQGDVDRKDAGRVDGDRKEQEKVERQRKEQGRVTAGGKELVGSTQSAKTKTKWTERVKSKECMEKEGEEGRWSERGKGKREGVEKGKSKGGGEQRAEREKVDGKGGEKGRAHGEGKAQARVTGEKKGPGKAGREGEDHRRFGGEREEQQESAQRAKSKIKRADRFKSKERGESKGKWMEKLKSRGASIMKGKSKKRWMDKTDGERKDRVKVDRDRKEQEGADRGREEQKTVNGGGKVDREVEEEEGVHGEGRGQGRVIGERNEGADGKVGERGEVETEIRGQGRVDRKGEEESEDAEETEDTGIEDQGGVDRKGDEEESEDGEGQENEGAEGQGIVQGERKEQEKVDRMVKEQGKVEGGRKEKEKVDQKDQEQRKVDGKVEEKRREDGERKEEKKVDKNIKEQGKVDRRTEEEGKVDEGRKEQGGVDSKAVAHGSTAEDKGPGADGKREVQGKEQKKVDEEVEKQVRVEEERKEQERRHEEDKEQGKRDPQVEDGRGLNKDSGEHREGEQSEAQVSEKNTTRHKCTSGKTKKSLLSFILRTKKLQIRIQGQRWEDDEKTLMHLRKTCHFVTSFISKLETLEEEKEEEGEEDEVGEEAEGEEGEEGRRGTEGEQTGKGESGIMRYPAPYSVLQESLFSAHPEPTAGHVWHRLPQKADRVQPPGTDGWVRPNDVPKPSGTPYMLMTQEHSTLSRRESQWSIKGNAGERQERTINLGGVLTETHPSTPAPPHRRPSPPAAKLPVPSGTGQHRPDGAGEGTGLHSVRVNADQHGPFEEAKDRAEREGMKIVLQSTGLAAEASHVMCLHREKTLLVNTKEHGKGKTEPETVSRKTSLSPSHLTSLSWDRGAVKKKGTKVSYSNRKELMQSITQEGTKDRFITDRNDKMHPQSEDPKVWKSPLSHPLNVQELPWKTKELRRKTQEDKNELMTHLTSRIIKLFFSKLQFKESSDARTAAPSKVTAAEVSNDIKELKEHRPQKENKVREEAMSLKVRVDPNDTCWMTEKSPILYIHNLNVRQWETKEQEESSQKDKNEPDRMLTKTSTVRSTLFLNMNPTIKKESTPVFTKFSCSKQNFQVPLDPKGSKNIKTLTGAILTSVQSGKQYMPQNQEEREAQKEKSVMFPKHQEMKVQEQQDERGVVVTKSTLLSPLPHHKLEKGSELGDKMPKCSRSAFQTRSNARETIPTESIGGVTMKDVKTKSDLPQKEEIDRNNIYRRGTDMAFKSKKFLPSSKLYRTELHMYISKHKGKKHEDGGKLQDTAVLRKVNASYPSPFDHKRYESKRILEERLRSKTSSFLPVPLSALSDAKKVADRETVNDHVRKRSQSMLQQERRCEAAMVALRIGVHCQVPRSSPMWHILNAKEWILDLKVLESTMHKDRGDSCMLVTQSFVSVSPMPLINLDSRNKANKATAAITESSSARQRGQSSHVQKSRVQKRANRESAKGDSKKLVKQAEHYVPRKNEEQLRTSNFMVTAQQSTALPHTESGRDAHSRHENMYSTKSAIRGGERLELRFPGQKSQPEKHEEKTLATFHSYPTTDKIEGENMKKETELMDNLKQTVSHEVSVSFSSPRETFKELQVALDTSENSKGVSVSEKDDQGPLQKALEKREYLLELLRKSLQQLQALLLQSVHLAEADKIKMSITTNVGQKKLEKDNNNIVNHEERKLQDKCLTHLTPEEKHDLINHVESKAVEIKLNQIPEIAKNSIQKFSFYLKQPTFEENQCLLYPRLHKKRKLPSWSPRLQTYSVEGKENLHRHFSVKTMEIKMNAFARTVRESYEMINAHEKMRLLPDDSHSSVKVPKQKNGIFLLFDEKSLHEIDLNLQHKYLHCHLGSSAESTLPKPKAFPKLIPDLNTTGLRKRADDSGANWSLPCDTEVLQERITSKEQHSHEDSLLFRRGLEPASGCTFDPGPQRSRVQEDTSVLSGLKSHVTPEKHKHYHVSFQETNTHKPFHINTQKNTTGLGDSQSRKISDYLTDFQVGAENSAMLDECMAPEVDDSDESIFLEANTYLSHESQKILYEVQNGIPSTNLFTIKDILPYLKSSNSKDSGSPHVRACTKYALNRPPSSSESHRRKNYRSPSKMHSPDWYHSSDILDIQSVSSCISFSEERFSWTADSAASYSLSSIKVHVAKNQSKSHMYPQSKERRSPRSNLCGNEHWNYDSHYCDTHKSTRKNKMGDYGPERSDYSCSQRKHKSLSKPHHGEIYYHPEKKQNKPFFYACIIDSMDVTPKMIRWNIPTNILEANFRVPQVAKKSSTWNICSLARNAESF